MSNNHRYTGFILYCLMLTLSACAPRLTAEQVFTNKIDLLVKQVAAQQVVGVATLVPAAVVCASVLQGGQGNRLEEYVAHSLTMQLRQKHEIYPLSRQNWFELREKQPLSFAGQSAEKRCYLDDLIVYRVATTSDEVLKQLKVQINASDAQGKTIPGLIAESEFTLNTGLPAAMQYQTKAKNNSIPQGLEERPYKSLDRLTYSLAQELLAAYRANIAGDPQVASGEVNVVLHSRAVNGLLDKKFINRVESALQQAIVSNKGFACTVSQRDFSTTFNQLDFYRKNRSEFAMDETIFQPGTVVLLAEIAPHKDGDKIGISLRALWRVTPLESNNGELIATNLAGSYLSGFTAKGYLAIAQSGNKLAVESDNANKSNFKYFPINQHGFE